MRLLYVDDDRINTLLFVETCRAVGGFEVESAETCGDALALVMASPPDLLVLDLHLPDGSGLELLAALRAAIDRAEGPPAVLCTADDGAELQAAARAAGFDACWSKPVDRACLVEALQRFSSTRTPW